RSPENAVPTTDRVPPLCSCATPAHRRCRPDPRLRTTALRTRCQRSRCCGPSLPSSLLNDAALRFPARLLLTPHDLAIALAQIVAAEQVRLDLEDRRSALLRVVAVHVAARVRSAVNLSKQDRGREHAHLRSLPR